MRVRRARETQPRIGSIPALDLSLNRARMPLLGRLRAEPREAVLNARLLHGSNLSC